MVSFAFHLVCIFVSTTWPSVFCYFGNFATDRFSEIGDTAYDLKWYNYPLKIQKYMVLIIARSQEPTYFTGLGVCHCSLEFFFKGEQLFRIHWH